MHACMREPVALRRRLAPAHPCACGWRPRQPPQALLVNSWVLAIMAAIIAIIVVAKGRIHVPEPLAHTHATNGVLPYVMPLDKSSM